MTLNVVYLIFRTKKPHLILHDLICLILKNIEDNSAHNWNIMSGNFAQRTEKVAGQCPSAENISFKACCYVNPIC